MQPSVEQIGDVTVVALGVDQLDASNFEDFKQQVAPIAESNPKLVLDMSRVRFVDSSGCGAILSCLKRLTAVGGDLKLCCINKPVQNIFRLIRLQHVCEILDTKEEAVRAFES